MTTTPLRYPLAADHFDGEAGISRDNGRPGLVDILNTLLAGGFLGVYAEAADLPTTAAEWQAIGFVSGAPEAGAWAHVTANSAPSFWDGAAWRTSGGALAPSGEARLLSIVAAAKSTNSVHASFLGDDASNDFPGPFTNPVTPRNLRVVYAALYDGGDTTITGTDQFDDPVEETFTAVAGTTVVGTKIFKTVTAATKSAVGAAAVGASIGTGDLIGIPAELADEVAFLWVGTTAEAVVVDDTLNTFAPTTTPAGTTYKLLVNILGG